VNIEGVIFNKTSSGFDSIAHQDGENAIGLDRIVDRNP
jgi:hypothetical protein